MQPDNASAKPTTLTPTLLRGSGVLGIAILVERAGGFLGHAMAARIAGPEVFGGYMLALATASTAASYSSLGIGTLATRFAAGLEFGSAAHRRFLLALAKLVGYSVGLVGIVLGLGAPFLAARVLGRPDLAAALRLSAVLAAAFVVYEALRGIFIGHQLYGRLLPASCAGALCSLLLLPLLASAGPSALVSAAAMALVPPAVLLTLALRRQQRSTVGANAANVTADVTPSALWRFGATQFGAVFAASAGSWVVAALLSRCPSPSELGYYAVAGQVRNVAATLPNLLTLAGWPLLAREHGEARQTHEAFVTSLRLSLLASVAVIGAMIVFLQPVLLFFGAKYSSSEPAVALLLATALIQMTFGPAANKLTLVSLRETAVINAGSAALLVAAAAAFVPSGGARGAAAAWLVAQVAAAAALTLRLSVRGLLPRRLLLDLLMVFALAAGLGMAGDRRWHMATIEAAALTAGMGLAVLAVLAVQRRTRPPDDDLAL